MFSVRGWSTPNGSLESNATAIAAELKSLHAADIVDSSDVTHLYVWKRDGLLAPFVPAEVAEKWPADERDDFGIDRERREPPGGPRAV